MFSLLPEKRNLNILVDMDGVVVNYIGGICRLYHISEYEVLNEWPADKTGHEGFERYGLLEGMINTKIAETNTFWSHLDPYPLAIPFLDTLSEVGSLYFCTKPSSDLNCVNGKREWIARNYPRLSRRWVFTAHKHLLERPDNILIDDLESNTKPFGSNGLVLKRPWNSSNDGYEDIIEKIRMLANA